MQQIHSVTSLALGNHTSSDNKSGPNLGRNFSAMDVNIGDIDEIPMGNNLLSQLSDNSKFNNIKKVTPVDNLVSEHQFQQAVANPQRTKIEEDLLEYELFEKAKKEFGELDLGDDEGEPFTPIIQKHVSSLQIEEKNENFNFTNDSSSSPSKSGAFPPSSKNPYLLDDRFPSKAVMNSVQAMNQITKVVEAIDHKIELINSSKKPNLPPKVLAPTLSYIHSSSNFKEILPTSLSQHKTVSPTTSKRRFEHINKAKDIINNKHAFFGEFF